MNGSTPPGVQATAPAWRRCGSGWCGFTTAVLPDPAASGILIVWSQTSGQVMYVGQGGIAKNLRWARQFKPLEALTDLLVTWATIPEDGQSGIRNFLVARLAPVYRDPPSGDPATPIRLPWEDA